MKGIISVVLMCGIMLVGLTCCRATGTGEPEAAEIPEETAPLLVEEAEVEASELTLPTPLEALTEKSADQLTQADLLLLLSTPVGELCDAYGLDISRQPDSGMLLPGASMASPIIHLGPAFITSPLMGGQDLAADPEALPNAVYIYETDGPTPFAGFQFGGELAEESWSYRQDSFYKTSGAAEAEQYPGKEIRFFTKDLAVSMFFEEHDGAFVLWVLEVSLRRENPELEQILTRDDLEGGVEFFIYLLEHFDAVRMIPAEEREEFANRFRHILMVFERDGLHEPLIQVVDYRQVAAQELVGVEQMSNRYGRDLTFYQIDVAVWDGGKTTPLPEGEERWIAGFVEDDYQYIDFVLPYDAAVQRLRADAEYKEQAWRVQGDVMLLGTTGLFSDPAEIPLENLIFYLLWMSEDTVYMSGEGYEGPALTQAQMDTAAQQFFGLDHVDGQDAEAYREELGMYCQWLGGFGGPTVCDVLLVEQEGNSLYLYYDNYGFMTDRQMLRNSWMQREVVRYTYVDGRLQSAEAVDPGRFTPVILSGENG